MKRTIFAVALTAVGVTGMAQNSALSKATAAYDKQDFASAIQILEEAIPNPKTTKQAEMYRKLGDCHGQLFNPVLLKATQRLPFDTLGFYAHMDGAIDAYIKSHAADIAPDEKGKVKPHFVKENKTSIQQMLLYPYFAAIFANEQGNVRLSRDYFVKCLEMPYCPVFTKEEGDSIIARGRQNYSVMAYYAALQSNQLKEWDTVLKYVDVALQDTMNLNDLYQMKIVALQQKDDSIQMGSVLAEAVERTGEAKYMRDLVTYYMRGHDRDGALAKVDELISRDPQNARAYYMKGVIEMNMTPYNYDTARENFQKALDLDANYLEAYKNMGACFINDVAEKMNRNEFHLPQGNTEAQVKEYRKILQEKVYPYYRNAQPYLEKLRELAPDQPDLWAEPLYIVYSNLFMNDKAEEIKAFLPK